MLLFKHVATYMITIDGRVVVQKKSVKRNRRRVPKYQAFGGCNNPSNIFRMINSLRLELMDESSFVAQDDQNVVFSPLCVWQDVLVQVLLVDSEKLPSFRLWSPESVRSHGIYVNHDPSIASAQLGRDIKRSVEIAPVSIDHMRGLGYADWREADGLCFDALTDVMNNMLRGMDYDDDVILLGEETVSPFAAIRGFLPSFNKSPLLKGLRRRTRECWRPMLWQEATALQNLQFAKILLEKTDPSAAKTASAALQGGLVALWKASADRYLARTDWIKKHFKEKAPDIEQVIGKLHEWLRLRDVRGVLRYDGFWDDPDHGTGRWAKYAFTNVSYPMACGLPRHRA